MKRKYHFSVIRQQDLNRWFDMFKQAGVLNQSQYHEYCKWVKGKTQAEVFRLIHKKISPFDGN